MLWFNRATYDCVLKGHFGLNEVAYTHLTSPIRRFPDLINHYQIKAFITGSQLPFSKEDLQNLSEAINLKNNADRDAMSRYMMSKIEKEAKQAVAGECLKYLKNENV